MFYEVGYVAAVNRTGLAAVVVGCVVNVVVCYLVARPVAGIGIVMRGFILPAIAVILALLFAPHIAPPVAFVIGVVGPLIGADAAS